MNIVQDVNLQIVANIVWFLIQYYLLQGELMPKELSYLYINLKVDFVVYISSFITSETSFLHR